MTIDRLIQMKEYVKSQFKGLMFTGNRAHEMNLLNDIYMLITAEIERQSVGGVETATQKARIE